jgi:hypothetical protein
MLKTEEHPRCRRHATGRKLSGEPGQANHPRALVLGALALGEG